MGAASPVQQRATAHRRARSPESRSILIQFTDTTRIDETETTETSETETTDAVASPEELEQITLEAADGAPTTERPVAEDEDDDDDAETTVDDSDLDIEDSTRLY